jgi:hypothetical protein
MTKTNDFLRGSDLEYDRFQARLLNFLTGKTTKFVLTTAEITELKNCSTRWTTAFAAVTNPATKTKVAVLEKDEARKALTNDLRFLINKYLEYNDLVTDTDRKTLGLTVRDKKPTPVVLGKEPPIMEVKIIGNHSHEIIFRGEEEKKAKPKGADGIEIRRFIGDKHPLNPDGYIEIAKSGKPPVYVEYTEEDFGKVVHYIACWYGKRSQKSNWCKDVSIVVN